MFQPNVGQESSNLPTLSTLSIILLALKLLELFKEQGTIKEGLIKFMMHCNFMIQNILWTYACIV
jgi:hypothetical protein